MIKTKTKTNLDGNEVVGAVIGALVEALHAAPHLLLNLFNY